PGAVIRHATLPRAGEATGPRARPEPLPPPASVKKRAGTRECVVPPRTGSTSSPASHAKQQDGQTDRVPRVRRGFFLDERGPRPVTEWSLTGAHLSSCAAA